MSLLRNIFIFALSIVSFVHCNDFRDVNKPDKLIFAQVIYRHGDRSIIAPYPTDPWGDESFWPDKYGGLTNQGKREHYALGKFFRKRYGSLLGNRQYSRDNVYILSTDEDRAIMSALANLAGLFPPINNQIWNRDLDWQPVPVHTIPWLQDYYVAAQASCARFDELQKVYIDNELFQQHKELLAYLELHSGKRIESVLDALLLHDTLFVESLKNMTLPDWTRKVFYPGSDLEKLGDEFFTIFTKTPEMTRLKYGFLLRELLDRFTSKIQSTLTPNRNLWFYSAHDITLASLLNILGLYTQRPPYASALMFELYKSSDDSHYVQLYYKNSTTENNLMEIPNCGAKCTVEQLYTLFADYLPTESFESGCLVKATNEGQGQISVQQVDVPAVLLDIAQNENRSIN